jgi:ABC-type Mn2+/Zn2+ transport system ATPase subunit
MTMAIENPRGADLQYPLLAYSRHRHGPPSPDLAALECVDVTVSYPGAERPAIQGITLSIPQGSRVALVGHNGAGKSTLLKAAAGLLPLTSGTIRVHGSPPGGCCYRVAYLAQRDELDWKFPMTVRRLVLTGRYVHLGWFKRPREADFATVQRALDVLQIGDLAERRISDLSGGQQQRALLARAMAQNADLLLLDEPMNAVDAATRQILRDVLRDLSKAGKTIVVATHDTHEIRVDFDEVIHLSCGCTEQAGSIDQVTLVHPRDGLKASVSEDA